MKFTTVVRQAGKTATGLPVPTEVVEALSGGKRAAVVVTLAGYSYRTTIGSMGGESMIPLSAEHRAKAGVAGGDEVTVDVELDSASRQVAVPDDLAAALDADPAATAFFAALATSHRKEYVRWIEEAKKPETRAARVTRTVEKLRARQPR